MSFRSLIGTGMLLLTGLAGAQNSAFAWVEDQTFGSPDQDFQQIRPLKDSTDWIAAGGLTQSANNHDVVAGRYGPDGANRWTVRLDGYYVGSDFVFQRVEVDPSSNVYLIGQMRQNSMTPFNVMVTKLNGVTGATIWTRVFDGSQSLASENIKDSEFDAGNNLYLSGEVMGVARGFLLKMTSDGALTWIRQRNGTSSSVRNRALLVDRVADRLYVLNTNLAGTGDITSQDLTQYDPAGNVMWNRNMVDAGNQLEFVDMAVMDNGPVLAGYTSNFVAVTVTPKVRRINGSNGADVWDRSFVQTGANGSFAKVKTGPSGIYLGGQNSPFFTNAMVVKYTAAGSPVWYSIYTPPVGSTSSYMKELGFDYADRPTMLATYGTSSGNNGSVIRRFQSSNGGNEYTYTLSPFQERMIGFAVNPGSGQVLAGGMRTGFAVLWCLNQGPVAATDVYNVQANHQNYVSQSVLNNDTWVMGLIPVVTLNVSHGTLQLWSTGAFTYTPTAGYTGTDTFRYRVTRAGCSYSEVTVTLNVN